VPVIVPELHLIQVQGELVRGDPVVLEQLPLGIAPKAFEPVDMDLPPTEPLAVIDGEPPIAAERERIVAAIFIGVDQRPPLDHLDRLLQERLGRDVRYDGDRDPSAPRPRFPLRRPPKYDSSASTSPRSNSGCSWATSARRIVVNTPSAVG